MIDIIISIYSMNDLINKYMILFSNIIPNMQNKYSPLNGRLAI